MREVLRKMSEADKSQLAWTIIEANPALPTDFILYSEIITKISYFNYFFIDCLSFVPPVNPQELDLSLKFH